MADNGSENRPNWWRTVLGEYPTGVTLITSLDGEGRPVAMVVGTFSAVSQDPALVAFMPGNDSSTFPVITARGRFVASVLGASHERLCRAFSQKLPERWDEGEWVATESGIPRLANAVAWFDGVIDESYPAGDHTIVVANVQDFGVGDANAGLPLLYLRGGYGSFTVPSLEFNAQGFARQLKLVDSVRESVREFAEELDVECVICGLASDSVMVLNAINMLGGQDSATRPVGVSFPFAAPLAPSFAAWGTEETAKLWLENSRHLLGSIDRKALGELLDVTRERGYAVSRGHAITDEFARVITDPASGRADLASLWAAIAEENTVGEGLALSDDVTSVQLPVIGPDGTAELVVVTTSIERALETHGAPALDERFRRLRDEASSRLAGAGA